MDDGFSEFERSHSVSTLALPELVQLVLADDDSCRLMIDTEYFNQYHPAAFAFFWFLVPLV